MDDMPDKMVSEEAEIGLLYSGMSTMAMIENENLDYVIPKEGSNIWVDSMFIPKMQKTWITPINLWNFF